MKLAQRMADIRPFFVMEILSRAKTLEQQGRDIVHMEIGEPDFPTPPRILQRLTMALQDGDIKYTPAGGLPALRQAIAGFYLQRYSVRLDPERVFITPGASGALLLALAALVNPGDEVGLADPGYPCYPNFIRLFEGVPRWLPVDERDGYNLSAGCLTASGLERLAGIILASPANPTGTVLSPDALRDLIGAVHARGGFVISDEIYHGLEYGVRATSALQYSDAVFVINSFSKYFGMTGWRLGWVVVPEEAIEATERLAQNLFISAPTHSQLAALAAFDPENIQELERRRQVFAERRAVLLAGLQRLGFHIRAQPEGAFYIYADASGVTNDSRAFALALLEEEGVAVTPGLDFGQHSPERFLRFCFTASVGRIEEGLRRMERFIQRHPPT